MMRVYDDIALFVLNQTWTQDTLNEIIATFHVIALHISDANFVNKLRSFYDSSLIYVS